MPLNQVWCVATVDARDLLELRLVRERQRHDQRDLVDQHQPIEPGDLDAEAERRADRHQDAEQQERDEDRQQRERGAELPPPDVLPDERDEFHSAFLGRVRPVTAPPPAPRRQHALLEVQRPPRAIGGVRIVRDHDDRLAVIAIERLQQIEDLVAGLAIEIAGRLVAEQQRRVGDDGARDADALLLAARQLTRVVLRAIGQPDDLQRDRRRASCRSAFESFVSSSGSSTLRSAVSTGSRL